MSLASMLSNATTSVSAMFSTEMQAFEKRNADEVAGDLAEVYLGFSSLARSQNDSDLMAAFEEMGELMRGYEHLRMMKTGELG